ncbi:MAG: YihY/virulence factor BrkB family protein [Thermomicrobiales bacterium]
MQIPGLHGLSLRELATRAFREFLDDDMSTYAAALSYHILLALFPFVIFLLTLLGAVGLSGFFDWILQQAQTALPDDAYVPVEEVVNQVQGGTQGGLLSFGIIAALWSASAGVRSLMNALNVAYDVDENRATWKRYILSIVFTIGLAAMLLSAAALMLLGPQAMEWLASQANLGDAVVALWTWLRWPVAVVLLALAVATVYHVVPNADQPLQFVSPGSVLAVAAWIAASLGFSFYISNFGNYSATYGSIGGIIMLLLYFFISSATLMLGAEINAVISREKVGSPDQGGQ